MLKFYRENFASGVMLIKDRKPKLDDKGKVVKGEYVYGNRALKPTNMSRPASSKKVKVIEVVDDEESYKKDKDGEYVMEDKKIPATHNPIEFSDEYYVLNGSHKQYFKKA